jgi:hypothetical protein
MSENEPQTLREKYSRSTKILDVEYKQVPASLDDVIKTCENLHVEEQHQLKTLLQKYEHLFDGKLGEFNMRRIYLYSALDLNMGYYYIKLDTDAQKLCTILFPWHIEKYKYKCRPMGIKIAHDVFQNVISKLFQDIEYVKTYLDALLILTNRNNSFNYHLIKL